MIYSSSGTGITAVTSSVTIGDNGIGTMVNNRLGTLSRFQMNSGAVFNFELSGTGGTSDQMSFYNFNTGEFVLNSNAINLALSGSQANGTYTVSLFNFYSDNGTTLTLSGLTSGLAIGTLGSGIGDGTIGVAPTLNYNSGGNSIDLTYEVVPEPSTLALLGLTGIAAIAYRIRRNRRS